MRDFIIKFLGGRTSHEYEMEHASLESWRQRAIAAETTVELVKEIMARESDRAKRLEERLLGDNHPQQPQEAPPFNPVGEKRLSSWPRIRRELERQNRVKENAEVPREEIERKIREG